MTTQLPTAVWCTEDDLPSKADTSKVPAETLELAMSMASTILFNLTGRVWPGQKETTIWPTSLRMSRRIVDQVNGIHSAIELVNGEPAWWARTTLDVDRYPVTDVLEVTIGGEPQDISEFRIDNGRELVWEKPDDDGRQTFPWQQVVARADASPGTWSVRIRWGEPVPAEAKTMAGLLAWQLALGMAPDSDGCMLPAFVQTQVRRGASVTIKDPMTLVQAGQVGYRPVDLWLASLNIGKSKRRASITRLGKSRKTRTHSTGTGS